MLLLLSGCKGDIKDKTQNSFVKVVNSVVIDTFGIENFRLYEYLEQPSWLSTAHYEPYYIGKVSDTLYIHPLFSYQQESYSLDGNERQRSDYFVGWLENKEYKYAEQAKLNIYVDTTNLNASTCHVIVTNIDSDTVTIGLGRHLELILEAKDSLDNWRPIQERFRYFCGTGLKTIILPPSECVVSLAPVYSGNYQTVMRLKMGENYSNSFRGRMNYGQFQRETK